MFGVILSRGPRTRTLHVTSQPRGTIAFVGPCEFPCRTPAKIFSVAADGSDRTRLIEGAQPAWSPSGSRLAFVDPLGQGLRLANADGSGLSKLTTCRSPTCEVHLSPTWSPDEQRVAFVAQPRAGDSVRSELAVVTLAENSVQTLLACPRDGCRSIFHPAWSPDGEHISFWDLRYDGEGLVPTLRMLQLSTSRVRTLYECPRCGEVSGPSWSVDGDAMVIDAGRNLFLIDASSGQLHRVTECHAGDGCGYPAWSPDGGWILFSRLTKEGGPLALFLVRPDGADLHPLGVEGYLASWRPAV
jgi:TolB protein